MHVQNCDWERRVVFELIKHQQHDSIAYFEFIELLMPENIKHLVSAKIPNSEAFILGVLSHYFTIQIIYFDKIGILKSKILK